MQFSLKLSLPQKENCACAFCPSDVVVEQAECPGEETWNGNPQEQAQVTLQEGSSLLKDTCGFYITICYKNNFVD